MTEFTLSRAIETHEGKQDKIKLQEVPGLLVLEHGLPYDTVVGTDGDNVSIVMKTKVMPHYLEAITGLDQELLAQVPANDLARLMQVVVTETAPAKNSPTS